MSEPGTDQPQPIAGGTDMRRLDAAAFLLTGAAVLSTHAVAAVALGCSLGIIRHVAARIATLPRFSAIGRPGGEPGKLAADRSR